MKKIYYELCVLIAMHTFFCHVRTAEDIAGSLESTVTLPCQYTDGSGFVVWSYIYTNGTQREYSNNRNILTWSLPQDLATRLNITGNEAAGEYNLQIKNMKNTDEGSYSCSLGLNYKQVNLYIPEAPSSVVVTGLTEGNRILGTEDKDLTVACTAVGGIPIPEISLKGKDDYHVYRTGSQTLTHTFSAISRQLDLKILICQANSTVLNNPLSKEIQIYLELKPLKPVFSHDPLATENLGPISVNCISRGSRPAASFQWTLGNTVITSNYSTEQVTNDTTTDTYTVTSTLTYTVNRNHNGQILTCGAVNKVFPSGISTSETVNVTFAPEVTVANKTYTQNDDIRTVICTAVGNPTTYTFKLKHKSKYGEVIREWNNIQNGVLKLPYFPVEDRYQDSGQYTCTVSNGVKDIHGQIIENNGTGYVKINGAPVFTEDNSEIQFGEIGKSATIEINVYSVPKYSIRKWLKDSNVISASAKYTMSETSAIVNSVFHNKEVIVDGYRLTLTINTLTENDFTGYDLQLSNGIGSEIKFSVKLESSGGPQTPSNFTVTDSSSTSVSVQWISGYNGGYTQTFHIEYRKVNSGEWVQHEVFTEPETQITDKTHVYELTGLQPETMYELRMFSSNERNQSAPTPIASTKTDSKASDNGGLIGGLIGSLFAAVLIIGSILVVTFFRHVRRKEAQQTKAQTGQHYDNIGFGDRCNAYEEVDNKNDKSKRNVSKEEISTTYESLTTKDKPDVYDDLKIKGDMEKIYQNELF